MLINSNTKIVGTKVILVPYLNHHVEKYHEWMEDEELQRLTASEPLSLEEEKEMQKSWANDDDKCTFIVLDKGVMEETNDEVKAMIGDTNIFLTKCLESDCKITMNKNCSSVESKDSMTSSKCCDHVTAEAEIMIAERQFRGAGRGKEAMLLMLKYAIDILGIRNFSSKIGIDNVASQKMFTSFGFKEVGRSEVFREITSNFVVDDTWKTWLDGQLSFTLEKYQE